MFGKQNPLLSLGWKQSAVQPLLDYLALKNSKGFIILVNGRIVLENYFNGHSASTGWYWASAGKTLTATLTGIAQQEGLLNINNKVSDYIGTGWTSDAISKRKSNYQQTFTHHDFWHRRYSPMEML